MNEMKNEEKTAAATVTNERDAFEAWAHRYDVVAEPNYSGATKADCWAAWKARAAFEAGKAGQCLHQIQEPSAAEQAAWHAGLDEGRAQAASSQRAMVRYCPECSHIGEVGPGHRDCCPDGSQAFMVPEKHAEGLRTGFLAQIAQAAPAAVAVPANLPTGDEIRAIARSVSTSSSDSPSSSEYVMAGYRAALAATKGNT